MITIGMSTVYFHVHKDISLMLGRNPGGKPFDDWVWGFAQRIVGQMEVNQGVLLEVIKKPEFEGKSPDEKHFRYRMVVAKAKFTPTWGGEGMKEGKWE